MTTTSELYRLELTPTTTTPDLLGVFSAARTALGGVSTGSTAGPVRASSAERAHLLASLAELSVQPGAGIDRALLAAADDRAWGTSDPE